ncbi:MAG TPA: lytic transglycosylase domain-containing protein [Aquifex aeolicus]|uniref:Lytic transglycosylase domain-containing protein n=1 Tax=Aquifex aeolicus TaxID=63363 RepID=A0A7C5Q133_AQUAO|nr:lytic transglycosylase domain-containing protein [Aquifex aeolicus]
MEKVLLALWLAGLEYGVSYELLYSIAKTESGLHPYAVNIGGRSCYPETKEQALSLIRGKENYDIGLMQINSYWIRKFSLKPEWLFDPFYSARWGAYILKYCQSKFGNTWRAVDCYHRGEKKASFYGKYSAKVCSILYGKENCWTF